MVMQINLQSKMASRFYIWFYLYWQLTWFWIYMYLSDLEFHWFSNQALTKLTGHHQNHSVAQGWLRDWRFIFLRLSSHNFVVCISRIIVVIRLSDNISNRKLAVFMRLTLPQKQAQRDRTIQFIVNYKRYFGHISAYMGS